METKKAKLSTGVQIEYSLSGPENGETLLFVHGLGPNLHQFEPQQRFFAQDYRVLLVSLRGHGGSSSVACPTQADYSVGELARDVQALLSYLNVEKVHFIGNSLGGLVGYELLKADAERVLSLTTFGTTAELHSSRFTLWALLTATRLLGRRGMAWLISKTGSKDDNVASRLGKMYRVVSKDALKLIAKNIADYDYTGTIRGLDTRMMLIKGGLDREINANLDSTLKVLSKKSIFKIVELPDAGHFANMEKPEAFSRIVLDFLIDCGRKGD